MSLRSVRNISHVGFIIGSIQAPKASGNIWTLSTSSPAIFSTVCSVSSHLVIERRIGGDFLHYTKKQKRYLPSEYTNSWKKLTCIYHRGHASAGAPTNTFTNALHDPLLGQWGLLPPRSAERLHYKTLHNTQMLIKRSESLGLQIYKNLDILVLLLGRRSKAILNNAIDFDLASNHLLRLHGSSAQSLDHTFLIIPLIAQH